MADPDVVIGHTFIQWCTEEGLKVTSLFVFVLLMITMALNNEASSLGIILSS